MRSQNLLDSFRFAFAGLWYVLRTQRNVRVHLAITAGVIAVGVWLGLSLTQWAVLALTVGFVLVSEVLNTVAETLVDLVSPGYHPLAKVVKDVTAGAVLLAAVVSVVVGLLILGRPLVERIF
ncbi:MAG: diacylglycerol kinase family protein [Chloroflexi bacterium]|nr:diacylglycerol kinase family protein [Chloroflexota bacterium]